MKKVFALLMAALLLFASAALAEVLEDESLGLRMMFDDSMPFSWQLVPYSEANGLGAATVYCGDLPITDILMTSADIYDDLLAPMAESYAALPGCVVDTVYQNGFAYLSLNSAGYYAADEDYAEQADLLTAVGEAYNQMWAQAEFFPPVPFIPETSVSFTTVNLDGETVTEAIFAGKKVTMINVWATWCNPCLNEMPELAQMAAELPDNAQILFLCGNLTSLDDANGMKIANAVAEKAGINKKSILLCVPDELTELTMQVSAYPSTFFVDEKGELYDQTMVIGPQPDAYREIMTELLAK